MTEERSKTTDEQEPKITAANKPEKVKDPRRVEARKKLALISKEAKARKARERLEAESPGADYWCIIAAVGVVVAAVSLYYSARRDRREERMERDLRGSAPVPRGGTAGPTPRSEGPEPSPGPVLDSFDE